MKKAVILARVSKKDGSQNTDRQVDDLTAVAQKEGWNIVKVFTEKTSGSKTPLKKRKPILQMLEMARAGKIDIVMLHELSRLSRRPQDIDKIINELIELKIPVYVNKERIYTLNEDGKRNAFAMIMIGMIKELAYMETEDLSYRIKSGLKRAYAKGAQKGRPEGTTKSNEQFLKENQKVISLLNRKMSIRETAKLANCSTFNVQKVKRIMKLEQV